MAGVTDGTSSPEDEEFYASWGLCILCVLLIGALITSYYLQIKRIRAIHETVVSIFAGMVVGLIIRLSPGHLIREMLSFKHTLFFNLLLPPIILNSGYELKQENFFRNFGVILTFAFAGTFISAVGLGVLVYIWSFLGLEGLKFTLLECLIFGSTLSATDPVTILAIFNTYKVDPKLYSVIFGESILNDAVSIVMYETLSQFHGEDIYLSSLFHGIGIFLLSFSISMALGVAFGLMCSLGLKHSNLALYPRIESCIVSLVAYCSYFFSNGCSMSGIVSLLFCGITLKHYAYHTMSIRTQRTTKYMFSVLAQLSENFIFIYLGLNLFTQEFQVFKPLFILVTTIAVMASRYAAVFPLSELINWVYHTRGQRTEELPHSYQMMLFWAGLRGAVGVALATGITGDNADALRTTVLVVVVLTVIIFGGTTARMLEVLGIRVGVEDEDDSDDEDGAWGLAHGGNLALQMGPGSRRYAGQNGRGGSYGDEFDENASYTSPLDSPYGGTIPFENKRSTLPGSMRLGGLRQPGVLQSSHSGYSGASSSDEEDGEPLAAAGTEPPPGAAGEERPGMVFRDGQWFTALDERYLLPLFSNSVASRRANQRKAIKRATSHVAGGSGMHTPERGSMDFGGEEYGDMTVDSENGKGKHLAKNFSGSVQDFFFARPEGHGTPTTAGFPPDPSGIHPQPPRPMSLGLSSTDRDSTPSAGSHPGHQPSGNNNSNNSNSLSHDNSNTGVGLNRSRSREAQASGTTGDRDRGGTTGGSKTKQQKGANDDKPW